MRERRMWKDCKDFWKEVEMGDIRGRYEFQVRSYECGREGFAHLATVCNYLQEAASMHAEALGFSRVNFAAAHEDISWVLTRLRVKMERYPRWGERVEVETYPRGGRKVVAWRDFILREALSGEVLGVATSEWMIINLTTRKVVAIPEMVFEVAKDLPLDAAVLGVEPFCARMKFPDEGVREVMEFLAQNGQIDLNGHVNNAHYIEWMMEPCYRAGAAAVLPREVEVVFRSETLALEKVMVEMCEGANVGERFHCVRSVDGRMHVVGRTVASEEGRK